MPAPGDARRRPDHAAWEIGFDDFPDGGCEFEQRNSMEKSDCGTLAGIVTGLELVMYRVAGHKLVSIRRFGPPSTGPLAPREGGHAGTRRVVEARNRSLDVDSWFEHLHIVHREPGTRQTAVADAPPLRPL